ncbi:hypothetical protein F1188_19355 [Roseospira marina]|uniref:Uncharacterized protein n=1 Tax=Roseospira marina TaxID=140057 RepID=A0A5M6I7E2_9PROT|nr:hypothetical protein [Roseospira marina]KAA5603755.1 hypothetical protein F1188_19355 [Roseospira marina]MBB4316055.1 hypothetical protein [Roseospira marina]MBB5089227.1 hypothetical protein [Roseospira marina]
MKIRRRMPRPGRHLPDHDAESLAELLADGLHHYLTSQGFTLTPTARPYRREDGQVSVRLCWRRREPGRIASVTVTHVVPVEGRRMS